MTQDTDTIHLETPARTAWVHELEDQLERLMAYDLDWRVGTIAHKYNEVMDLLRAVVAEGRAQGGHVRRLRLETLAREADELFVMLSRTKVEMNVALAWRDVLDAAAYLSYAPLRSPLDLEALEHISERYPPIRVARPGSLWPIREPDAPSPAHMQALIDETVRVVARREERIDVPHGTTEVVRQQLTALRDALDQGDPVTTFAGLLAIRLAGPYVQKAWVGLAETLLVQLRAQAIDARQGVT